MDNSLHSSQATPYIPHKQLSFSSLVHLATYILMNAFLSSNTSRGYAHKRTHTHSFYVYTLDIQQILVQPL